LFARKKNIFIGMSGLWTPTRAMKNTVRERAKKKQVQVENENSRNWESENSDTSKRMRSEKL
jgi:hypothetical protein